VAHNCTTSTFHAAL